MEMENAYLYTFSTIPQVLIGFIAFSAAVVILRLNALDSTLRSHVDHMIDDFLDKFQDQGTEEYRIRIRLTKDSRQNNIADMHQVFATSDVKLRLVTVQEHIDAFESDFSFREEYLKKFKLYMCVGSAVTIISLPLITLSPFLVCNSIIGYCVAGVMLILTCAFIFFFSCFLTESLIKA
jgi:hypothetical protein